MTCDVDDADVDEEFDAFEYVPDRIDAVTASGIEAMYEELGPVNRARCRESEIEVVAQVFWNLVDKGAIDWEVSG